MTSSPARLFADIQWKGTSTHDSILDRHRQSKGIALLISSQLRRGKAWRGDEALRSARTYLVRAGEWYNRDRVRESGVRVKGRQRYCQRAKEPAGHERVGERRRIRCWEHDRHEALAAFRLQFCFSNGQGDYRNSDAIRQTVIDPKRYRYR